MRTVSNAFTALHNAEANCEIRNDIAGTIYTKEEIYGAQLASSAIPGETPTIGNAIAAQLQFSVEPKSTIPRMAEIKLELRLTDGTTSSEWLPYGTYFIDTRETSADGEYMEIAAYDAMLKAEQTYKDLTAFTTWPQTDTAIVNEICTLMGVTLDSRTSLAGYAIGYPNDYTMRKMLGYIAAGNGGNWIITPENKLRLVPLVNSATAINVGRDMTAFTDLGAVQAFTGVTLYYADESAYTAGNDTGRVLEADMPWATQAMADALLASIQGYVYHGFSAENVNITPAFELGDIVTANGVTAPIMSYDVTFDGSFYPNISAPSDLEVDNEYKYESKTKREFNHAIRQAKSSFAVEIDGIRTQVEDAEETLHSEIVQLSDSISLSVSQSSGTGGNTYANITLRVGGDVYTGQILLNGNVNISGELSADALYAALGDIADLQVNRVQTSRRIVKYLTGDTSDDNYISMVGEKLSFISGIYTGGVEQAKNGNGVNIYWESDPEGEGVVIGTDGYPYKNGVRIFTTSVATQYPVYIYTYNELVKAGLDFELSGTDYVPVLTMGAGDQNGRNKFRLRKDQSGLRLIYTATTGKEIGLLGTTDGFLDPVGLRRITSLDFSHWTAGYFSITSEGGVEMEYDVTFNSQGIPTRINGPRGQSVSVII